MAIIMAKGCLEAIYGLMGWKGLKQNMFRYGEESMLLSYSHAMQEYFTFTCDQKVHPKTAICE